MGAKRFFYLLCGFAICFLLAAVAGPAQTLLARDESLSVQPTPTPTIGPPCGVINVSGQGTTYCTSLTDYYYSFTFYVESGCPDTLNGTATTRFEVAPTSSGPWTEYDTQTFPVTYHRGYNGTTGNFSEPSIPEGYSWYRINIVVIFPGYGSGYNATANAPLCDMPVTSTPSTTTPAPTVTSCPNGYGYTVSTGTIVSGTTLLAGSQCGTCVLNLPFPFPVNFYGQTFTSANVSTQGNLQFNTMYVGQNTCPLPDLRLGAAMLPHWDDFLGTGYHPPCEAAMGTPCGIYTSVSGVAPNRIFNIEWRAQFISTSQHTANFEIRLYENSPNFEFIYGTVSYGGGYASIGVQDGGCRFSQYSCETWNSIQPGSRIIWGPSGGTVTPVPTPPCCNNVTGEIDSSCAQTSYRYNFALTNMCGVATTGSGGIFFEVSPNSTGPWTSPIHGDYFNYQVVPGRREEGGVLWAGALPPGNNWYRYRLFLSGNCWTVNVASLPQPACLGGTVTPPTATPSPMACPQNYTYATAAATILPGTLDTGNHCDDCFTEVTLPFTYRLYDQTFSSVHLESNGRATFPTPGSVFPVECLPQPGITYTIFPYWDDLVTDCTGCGIYTSVAGTAPSRIFSMEWRAGYFSGGGSANFEVRLYEGQTRFDVLYGALSQGSGGSLAGVQKDNTSFTQYACNGQGGDMNIGRLVVYTLAVCGSPTTIPPTLTSTTVPTGTPSQVPTRTVTITPAPEPCTLSFTDVPPENTFYSYVHCLACRGIVGGYSDGTFRPNNSVTRGQAAKFVSNAAGYNDEIPSDRQTFEDVPPGHPFWLWIERLAIPRGGVIILGGYPCGGPGEPCNSGRGYFRPFLDVTRGQLAKVAARAAGFSENVSGQTFEDVPPSNPFYVDIERLAVRGVMGGYACGGPGEPCSPQRRAYFRPFTSVTRGQTSKIIANTFFPNCTPLR
ncbi:MAG TPA: S-layer homology domain-containing protein [Chloroflexia bacterium]|nr:S-layer homology domain-containing protein [Chloroflexia bacterium]